MLFSFSTATLLASATTVVGVAIKRDICNANLDPIQIRLAYAGEGGMAISWNTLQQMNNPTVHYGLRGNLDHSASSTISTTYQTSSTWNNHVTISGLLPDTRYDYKIECDNRAYSFITPRTVGKGTSYKFAMVGDMGTFGPDGLSTTVGTGAANPLSPGEQTTINSLHSMKPDYDFIWHGQIPFCGIFSLSNSLQLVILPMPMHGSMRRKRDMLHPSMRAILGKSMIRFLMISSLKLKNFHEMFPTWLPSASSLSLLNFDID
jgi:hypothetical protein